MIEKELIKKLWQKDNSGRNDRERDNRLEKEIMKDRESNIERDDGEREDRERYDRGRDDGEIIEKMIEKEMVEKVLERW